MPDIGSAEWWLSRLDDELTNRRPDQDEARQLVDGVHPLPASRETSEQFRRMAGLSTTNLCGLVVEATSERMEVEGIRVGDEPDSDSDAWSMWQNSNFDAGSQECITAALIYGRSFVSVEPTADGPRFHYEDPRQVVVAHSPDGQRVAALKVFQDEWTDTEFATLYLPNQIVRLANAGDRLSRSWKLRSDDAVSANPIGEVPFFELQNRPLGAVRSEIAPLVTPQKLLNQTMYNIQSIAEYGAFRQKWATGIEVPRNPETGDPLEPFEAHVAKLIVSEDSTANFGDFNVTDMKPYIDLSREIAGQIARISRLPITYFLTEVNNVGAETLALVIAGLVSKCQRRVKGYEPAFEDAVRLAFRLQGDPRGFEPRVEMKWADMETRSMAQAADAAVKLVQAGTISPQTAQEKYLGMSPTERARDDSWRRRAAGSSILERLTQAAQQEPQQSVADEAGNGESA